MQVSELLKKLTNSEKGELAESLLEHAIRRHDRGACECNDIVPDQEIDPECEARIYFRTYRAVGVAAAEEVIQDYAQIACERAEELFDLERR